MTVLQVIVGSTRPGRVGGAVADWFVTHAREDPRFEVEVIDLAEVDLPLLDEPNHPRLGLYTHEHTWRWSETIDRGDAYVFVAPEYNHTMSAALKNAIDFLSQEWARKPLGIVCYGGASGGLRAAHGLELVGSALRMLVARDIVAIHQVHRLITGGRLDATVHLDRTAMKLLDELATLAIASRAMRTEVRSPQRRHCSYNTESPPSSDPNPGESRGLDLTS